MSDQESHNYHFELISKYLSGNASAPEIKELETWVMAAPENKERFIAFKKAWLLTGMEQNAQEVDVDQAWNQANQQLFETAKVVPIKKDNTRRRWLQIAAAIAVLIAASIWVYQNNFTEKVFLVETNTTIKDFDLSDGSHITLNKASSLRFEAVDEENKTRNVQLEGDAFFDVARDEAHPFIIKTQGLEIEVLGTSFYVDSRKEQEEVQVIVEEGSVAVRIGQEEKVLTANEKAIFKKEEKALNKEANTDPNFQFLKTNTLTFNNSNLEEIVFALNRQFNTTISIQVPNPSTCIYGSNISFKEESLEIISQVIASGLGIEVKKEDNQILFTGAGCK